MRSIRWYREGYLQAREIQRVKTMKSRDKSTTYRATTEDLLQSDTAAGNSTIIRVITGYCDRVREERVRVYGGEAALILAA